MSPIATVSETFIYENGQLESSVKQYSTRRSKCLTPDTMKTNLARMFTEARRPSTDSMTPVNNLHLSFFKPSDSDISEPNNSMEEAVKVISLQAIKEKRNLTTQALTSSCEVQICFD